MDLNALLSEKIETIFFVMTRYSLLYFHIQGGENEFRKCLMASIGYLGMTATSPKRVVVPTEKTNDPT